MKCPICDRKHKNDGRYCRSCQIALDKDKASKDRRLNWIKNAVKFIHYQGHIVGFFRKNGNLIPRYIGMSLAHIPKRKLINLDEYCAGYTREQIKKLKTVVLKLSH